LMDRAVAPIPIADAPAEEPVGGGNEAAADAAAAEDPEMQAKRLKSEADWAVVNSVRREVMSGHWEGDPFWKLIASRKIMTALLPMQAFKLARSGWKWEVRQQAKVARALNRGLDPNGCREYRAQLAAENVAETKCMQKLQAMITQPKEWSPLMDNEKPAQTVHGRALVFLMTTRAAGATESLLIYPHQGYPWVMFRLPKDHSLATKITKDAQNTTCKGGFMDDWSLGVARQFPTEEDLVSPDCMAVIFMFMLIAWVCTGTLETLHATIRRFILACSVQASTREFMDIQCSWMANTARRMQSHFAAYSRKPAAQAERKAPRKGLKRKRVSDDTEHIERPKAKRPGGPWRVFVRLKTIACKRRKAFTMMPTISREYKELTAAERDQLAIAGVLPTGQVERRWPRLSHRWGAVVAILTRWRNDSSVTAWATYCKWQTMGRHTRRNWQTWSTDTTRWSPLLLPPSRTLAYAIPL